MKAIINENDMREQMLDIGKKAKESALILSNATTNAKNKAILESAKQIRLQKDNITTQNAKDMALAAEKGLDKAMLDRLELNDARIESMAKGLENIARLDDPVGRELSNWERPSGLKIAKIAVPLGVIGIIYESRPNVTADAGALCLKSGNAAILRGGSESFNSSKAIIDCLHAGLKSAGLPTDCIQSIPTKDREAVGIMLTMPEYIDVIIPRGGKGLCKRVQDESKVPTLLHLDGNCHTYIHEDANAKMAVSVIYNAKLRRTGICGATESIVIDKNVVDRILPKIVDSLSAKNCEIRGDKAAQNADNRIVAASEDDWSTEYLDSIISVKTVDNIEEAIPFINKYSSHHTDAIITANEDAAGKYLKMIDSAIVMHNTSTQFADGGEFGMGAEIGISTGKLHARGPVGVEQLTTFKYTVKSDGITRP